MFIQGATIKSSASKKPSTPDFTPHGACPLSESSTLHPVDLDNMRDNSEEHGWSISYHQMGEGCLELSSTTWNCGKISLMSESSNICLQMIGVPPPAMVTVLIPYKNESIWFNGCNMSDQSMAVLFPVDRLRFVAKGGTHVISMHIPLFLLEAVLTKRAANLSDSVSEGIATIIEDGLSVSKMRDLMVGSMVSDVDSGKQAITEAVLVEKLVSLLLSHDENFAVGQESLAASKVLSKVDAFLASSANEPVRMAQLVQFAGLSERSLERMCRDVYDITPGGYIAAFRLNAVRENLLKPDLKNKTISEIAMDSGFRHLGRFSAEFRRYFGKSPRQYRVDELEKAVA